MGDKTVTIIDGTSTSEKGYNKEDLINEIGENKLKQILSNIIRTRIFDQKIEELIRVDGYSILQHSGQGQEATPAAATAAIEKNDYIMPYHRGWGWAIGKGMDPQEMIAEMLGKKEGCCEGKGGAQLADWDKKVMGRPGIQGAHLSIAAGIGLHIKMNRGEEVVVSLNGDGSSNSSNFYEGINLAAVWGAPVIYIVENNKYSITQHISEVMKLENIADRSVAFNIPGYIVDGNDAIITYKVISDLVKESRNGKGPYLIETKTYRWLGHTVFDYWHKGVYRSEEEIEEWKKHKDPLKIIENDLLEHDVVKKEEIEKMKEEASVEMETAAQKAVKGSLPSLEELIDDSNLFV